MPNSQQNPPRCKSLLVEEALEYACNSNDAGFSRIRDEVLVHPDRVQVEWAIMDALLMKGFIHLAIDMTDTVRVVAWVDQHAQRLANNPGLLNTWRWNMYKDPGLVAHCLGIIFETLGSQKIALLQDTLGTALGVSGVVRVLHPGRDLTDLLRRDASRWQEMSPIWMGTVGSATRRMATMRGWTDTTASSGNVRASRASAERGCVAQSHPIPVQPGHAGVHAGRPGGGVGHLGCS